MSNNNKNRLGKGLDALIPTEVDEFAAKSMPKELKVDDNKVVQVDAKSIVPNPYQPRREFIEDELVDLALSIKTHGIVQPLIVTREDGKYQLIAGERRLRAAKRIGLEKVPVIVRSFNKQEQLEIALIENIQRSELKPLELSTAYQKLIDQFNLHPSDIAERVGKAVTTVYNTIRLLGLPHAAKVALNEGKISEGHARTILSISDPDEQAELLRIIIEQGITVRRAEELARNFAREGGIKNERVLTKERFGADITDGLGKYLGTKVNILKTSKGGKLQIAFYSDEELARLYSQIMREQI